MSLNEQINSDFMTAYKAKEEAKVSTLRMLKSALKNKQIEVQHELSDEEVQDVVKYQIKQLNETLEMAESAGRSEMVEGAKAEITLLETYLPAQLDDAELEELVKTAVAESGASSKADFGKAMGAAVKAVAGRADGGRVKAMVEKVLVALVLAILITPTVGHAGLFSLDISSAAYFETMLRIGRVTLMVMGLMFVNMILMGGFTYMLASGRNDEYNAGIAKMVSGMLGTVIIAMLFSFTTIWLGKF